MYSVCFLEYSWNVSQACSSIRNITHWVYSIKKSWAEDLTGVMSACPLPFFNSVTAGWTTDLVDWSSLCLTKWRSVWGFEAALSHVVQSVSSLLRPTGQNVWEVRQNITATEITKICTDFWMPNLTEPCFSFGMASFLTIFSHYKDLMSDQIVVTVQIKCRLNSFYYNYSSFTDKPPLPTFKCLRVPFSWYICHYK